MRFSKVVILFAGSAIAAPTIGTGLNAVSVASSPAKSSSTAKAVAAATVRASSVASAKVSSIAPAKATPAAASKAASTSSAKPSTPTLTVAQANTIIADLTSLDRAVQSGTTAVNGFTGGSNVQAQGDAVETAGEQWQTTIAKLLSDVQALSGKGKFCDTESSKITSLVTGTVTPHLVTLYQAIQSKKSVFVQVGKQTHVYNTLMGLMNELQSICDTLTPMMDPSDLSAMQAAGIKLTTSAQAVLVAYGS